jgi:hypothetical protein
VLVFVFYLFHAPPVHWNEANLVAARNADASSITRELESAHMASMERRSELAARLVEAWRHEDSSAAETTLFELKVVEREDAELRQRFRAHVAATIPGAEKNDKDYVFISFIMENLPVGVIGLLLAMIFCAGMSGTSSELSALATTWTIDVRRKDLSDHARVRATRIATVAFGVMALAFAALFSLFENLIQAVNILGSLFYGTILGIFLVAFFVAPVQGRAVFVAALVAQATILCIFFSKIEIAFLWYNLIAPAIVVVLAIVLQAWMPRNAPPARRPA